MCTLDPKLHLAPVRPVPQFPLFTVFTTLVTASYLTPLTMGIVVCVFPPAVSAAVIKFEWLTPRVNTARVLPAGAMTMLQALVILTWKLLILIGMILPLLAVMMATPRLGTCILNTARVELPTKCSPMGRLVPMSRD